MFYRIPVSWLDHYSFVELEDRIFAESKFKNIDRPWDVELGL